MKKYFCAVLSLFFMLSFFLPAACAEEESAEVRTVRVGLVEQPGEQNRFAYQMLLSYVQGYLNEASKQTRWQYIYEHGSYRECVERLRRGELDFVGPVQPGSAARGMIFVGGAPDWTILQLYKRADTPRHSLTPESAQTMTVGVLANDGNSVTALSYFMASNGWPFNIREFDDGDAMIEALRSGEVDAVCDDGTHAGEEERYVVTVGIVPARLMTTPDKARLSGQLTEAFLNIEMLSPGFGTLLKGEYLDRARQTIVRPTQSDQRFVENTDVLRVAFPPDFDPFYKIGDGSPESAVGLYVDMLKLMSNVSGLRFSFCRAESEARLWEMLESGEADLAFASYVNGGPAKDMYFTGNVREEEFAVVRHKADGVGQPVRNTAAIPEGFPGAERYFSQKYHLQVRTLATPEECLDAVERGHFETAFIPALYLQRESSMVFRSALEQFNRETTTLPVAIVLSSKQPRILQNVLNTAILRMENNEIGRLVQENARPRFSMEYLLYQYPLWTTIFICTLIVGMAVLFFMLYRHRLQTRQSEILQRKNEDLENALRREEAMRISRDGYKLESETDKLTAVYNKMGFENAVRKRMGAIPDGAVGAFYIMDLDHFKEANDTYGHQCGDEILQKFSAALKEVFRQSDCIGRFGGDEFVVFIAGELTRAAVERKARQTLEAVRHIVVENADVEITASIGIAMYPEHGDNYDYLFNAADRALYQVKSEGRDGYSVASSGVTR